MKNHLLSTQFPLVLIAIALVGCTNGTQSNPNSNLTLTIPVSPITSSEPTGKETISPWTSGTAIPFQSFARSFKLGDGLPNPALLVATDEISLAFMASLISKKDQSLLKKVDLKKDVLVAVFWGTKPSGGFSITVRDIFINGNELTVILLLQEKDPNFPKIDATTLPYHIVTIGRNVLPENSDLLYRLISDDKVLARGKLE